ncbi:MAG: transcriptional regulator GcvA [Gammaproteobacteria bacterium]
MSQLPPLNSLRVFDAAARHENFSLAATELNVTQSAVSRQIQTLERRLGRQLFVRRGPRLELTAIGRDYHGVVRSALDQLRRGTQRLFRAAPQSHLTISVLPSFAASWLVPWVADFEARHPGLSLRLASSYAPVDFNEESDIDVAVRYGRGKWAGVEAHLLVDEVIFPVCSPAVAAKLKRPEDLSQEKLFVEDPHFDEWTTWARAAGIEVHSDQVHRLSDDFNVQLQAATQGQGVALGRRLMVANDLRAGRLVCPFPLLVPGGVQYYFVAPPERFSEPAVDALRKWMQNAARRTVEDLGPYLQQP